MKQVITVDHDEIVAAIKEHLSKHVSPGYTKQFNIGDLKFTLNDNKVQCEIPIDIVGKEEKK